MAAVLYSASAENDLLEAWLYLADDSVLAADRMLDQIEAEAKRLLDQPIRKGARLKYPTQAAPAPFPHHPRLSVAAPVAEVRGADL